MNNTVLLNFIDLTILALQVLILGRVLLSWINPHPRSGPGRWLVEVTDPVMLPFQKILPPMAGLDFSPILALVSLQILQGLLHNWIG